MCPTIEIEWIAGSPASDVLIEAGETLAPRQSEYRGETDVAEMVSRNGSLSLTAYVYRALVAWFHNARLIGDVASRGEYDVIVGQRDLRDSRLQLLRHARASAHPVCDDVRLLGHGGHVRQRSRASRRVDAQPCVVAGMAGDYTRAKRSHLLRRDRGRARHVGSVPCCPTVADTLRSTSSSWATRCASTPRACRRETPCARSSATARNR